MLVARHEPTCISVARCARIIFCSLKLSLPTSRQISALPVELVWKWADVPCSGSGSPTSGALPPETARKQPSEPPKIDLEGVDGVDEARPRTPPNPLSTPPLLRCGGRAAERCYRRA